MSVMVTQKLTTSTQGVAAAPNVPPGVFRDSCSNASSVRFFSPICLWEDSKLYDAEKKRQKHNNHKKLKHDLKIYQMGWTF